MSTTNDKTSNDVEARVTELQEVYMHLSRTVQDLDEAMRGLQRRLDTVESAQRRVAEDVLAITETLDEEEGEEPS